MGGKKVDGNNQNAQYVPLLSVMSRKCQVHCVHFCKKKLLSKPVTGPCSPKNQVRIVKKMERLKFKMVGGETVVGERKVRNSNGIEIYLQPKEMFFQ